ncbi:MAG: FtsQ-type POTRA domain-containing protein [Cyanobacteria bacterium J06642_2]
MTASPMPTRQQLQERRRELRRRYRTRYLKECWRVLVSTGLLGGAIYALQLPVWSVADLEGVDVTGNVLLTTERVRSYVETSFPEVLWRVEPRDIERQLESHALIRQARVNRQLWPLDISIHVEEHEPVARARVDNVIGLVDRNGIWVPLNHEASLTSEQPWQSLWVKGWEFHHPEDWKDVLDAIRSSSVEIANIDWISSSNLILETELGTVHLGSLPERTHAPQSDRPAPIATYVAKKLQALDQMRNLAQHCDCSSEDIDYIDLSSSEAPTIALTASAARRRF